LLARNVAASFTTDELIAELKRRGIRVPYRQPYLRQGRQGARLIFYSANSQPFERA
jgi:hypothetical protein